MINTYNQTPLPQKESSTSMMKMFMWIFTLFFMAQIIGTCFFGVYFYKRLDKIEEEINLYEDYVLMRRIQKCKRRENPDPTLLDCKKVVAKFQDLISEVTETNIPGKMTLTAQQVGEKSSQDIIVMHEPMNVPVHAASLGLQNNLFILQERCVATQNPHSGSTYFPPTQVLAGITPLLCSGSPALEEETEKVSVAIHLVGEKSNNTEVLQWMSKGYATMRQQIAYSNGKLKVEIPGVYYVYSQVSFCVNTKQSSRAPFLQYIYLRRQHEMDKLLLKGAKAIPSQTGDCSLHSLQQGAVFTLKQNDQLFVNVTDSSYINYSPGLTYFGMFKL
ncbi:CD40 ligand [Spea bombifrons]|uniref:CD40 ligand n=1 Tax=Spea bombifrons TaxID=233779 RepID=UPI0023495CAE|nr:CD40 ligand [Spea bombifrons]